MGKVETILFTGLAAAAAKNDAAVGSTASRSSGSGKSIAMKPIVKD